MSASPRAQLLPPQGRGGPGGAAGARGRPTVPLAHRLAGEAVRLAARIVQLLPSPLVYGLAEWAALLLIAATLLRERRAARRGRGLGRNLRIAFRDRLSPARRRWLLANWARHMTWLGVDLLRLPCITRRNLRQRVDTRGLERAWPAYSRGRGLICVTGHIGVFELIAHAASLWGYQVTEVARPLAMAPVDEAVRALRSAGGVEVLAKWNVLWHLRRALGRGRVVGLTADETVRRNAVFVPFLGTLAATNPSPALLHLASGAPLCVVTCHRVRRERYRIEVWDLFEHAPSGDRQADVEAIMTRINAALGRAILARPAQWFWGMRRYEHRPPGEQPGPDGLPPPA